MIRKDFGLVNARYLRDWHHLFDTGLKDLFGAQVHTAIGDELRQMVRARTETYFQDALHNARQKLQWMVIRDGKAENTLDKFTDMKHEYAQFEIFKMQGSRGFHGSSHSESNHSSTLCYLNDGHSPINDYREDGLTLVKDLLGCQNRHCIQMNKLLDIDNTEMINKMERLRQTHQSPRNLDLATAAKYLCKPEYEYYKSARTKAESKLQLTQQQDGVIAITDVNPEIPPTIFFNN